MHAFSGIIIYYAYGIKCQINVHHSSSALNLNTNITECQLGRVWGFVYYKSPRMISAYWGSHEYTHRINGIISYIGSYLKAVRMIADEHSCRDQIFVMVFVVCFFYSFFIVKSL